MYNVDRPEIKWVLVKLLTIKFDGKLIDKKGKCPFVLHLPSLFFKFKYQLMSEKNSLSGFDFKRGKRSKIKPTHWSGGT